MHEHHVKKAAFPVSAAAPDSLLGLRRLHHGSIDDFPRQAEILILADCDFLTGDRLRHIDPSAGYALTEIRCQVCKVASGWTLTQHSRTVNCAVNDAALDFGKTVALSRGDRIELGMLRLIVTEDDLTEVEPIQTPTTSAGEAKALRIQDGIMDPFAHLPQFQSDIRGDTSAFHASSSTKQDVIDELAGQFIMTVTDVGASYRPPAGPGISPSAAQAFPTQQKSEKNIPAHFSLEDILSGQLSVEQVLTDIGQYDAQWDQPEGIEDVLMLFADGIARRTQSHLPDLTRREHHAVSPDSHVAMRRIADRPVPVT